MELDFQTSFPDFSSYEEEYQRLLGKTLHHLGLSDDVIVSVSLVDNEFIHKMNRDYRHIDHPTDVISFAFLDGEDNPLEMLRNPISPVCLGDIYISVEKAAQQANDYGHPLKRELQFLFVHGLLHLLGYDHMSSEEEKMMFALQDKILKKGVIVMEKEKLIEKAKEATKLSYSPYSKFKVGAAVECKDGSVFLGANIENSSYPLCMCAERNALYNAYMHGYKKEDLIAFALIGDTDEPISPCGACRQVISELYPSNKPIYMANLKGMVKETNSIELLPFAFSPEDLK